MYETKNFEQPGSRRISVPGIIRSFLKVGAIGFGGGSALIPIVERELVHARGAVSEEEYVKHTVVANITPGALPVKLGATCGQDLGGSAGSLGGAYAVTLPGMLLTVAIMSLFTVMGPQIVVYFNYASVGITAFIVFLLLSFIRKTLLAGTLSHNLALCLLAFGLTGGKEVREIAASLSGLHLGTPLLDISTIDLMIISFGMILLSSLTSRRGILLLGGICCGGYAFLAGKYSAAWGWNHLAWVLLLPLLLLIITLFLRSQGGRRGRGHLGITGAVYRTVALFLLVPALLTAAVVLITRNAHMLSFLSQICLSTITSFGGGEAYVSVADGIFVQGGYIQPDVFYTRLVPVANALPGPILVKLAAGIGYVTGLEQGGSSLIGWLVAITAACAAVGTCSSVAVLLLHLYDSIKDSHLISSLKRYILPVICGMLLSTSCSMLFESMKVLSEKSWNPWLSFAVLLAWIAGLFAITKRRHLNDLLLLLVSAAVSILALFLLP